MCMSDNIFEVLSVIVSVFMPLWRKRREQTYCFWTFLSLLCRLKSDVRCVATPRGNSTQQLQLFNSFLECNPFWFLGG